MWRPIERLCASCAEKNNATPASPARLFFKQPVCAAVVGGGQAQKLHTQLFAKESLHVVVTFAVCETPISFALFITCQLFIHDGATLIKGATRANMTKILLAYSVVKALRQGCVVGRGVGTTSAWLRLQTTRHFSVKVRKKT